MFVLEIYTKSVRMHLNLCFGFYTKSDCVKLENDDRSLKSHVDNVKIRSSNLRGPKFKYIELRFDCIGIESNRLIR